MTIRDGFWPLRVACALAVLCVILPAHAAVIYSNFGVNNAYEPALNGIPVMSVDLGPFTPAMGFTPAHDYALTQIDVALSYLIGVNSVALSLYSDDDGIPGDVLMSWTPDVTQPFGGCCAVVTVLPGATVILDQGSLYWVVIAAIAPSTFDSWDQNSIGAIGPQALDLGTGFLPAGAGTLGAFDVLGDQVPEPVTMVLCGGGLTLLAFVRRFKR